MDKNFCPIINSECKQESCMMWVDSSCIIVNYLISDSPPVSIRPKDINPLRVNKVFASSVESLAGDLIDYAESKQMLEENAVHLGHDVIRIFWADRGVPRIGLPSKLQAKQEETKFVAERMLEERLLDKLNELSNAELAMELFSHAKENISPYLGVSIAHVSKDFWRQRGIDFRNKTSAIKEKIREVEELAEALEAKENEKIERHKIEREKKRLKAENEMLPKYLSAIVNWASEKELPKLINQDIETFMLEKSLDLHPATKRMLKLKANSELKSRHR